MNDNSLNVSEIIDNQSLVVSEYLNESQITIESHLIENLQKTQTELTILATNSVQNELVLKPVSAKVESKDDISFINPSILTQYDAVTTQKVQEIANNLASSTKLSNEQKQIIAQFYGI
jgi:cobalamin biosynthesis Mg chelatase CobN